MGEQSTANNNQSTPNNSVPPTDNDDKARARSFSQDTVPTVHEDDVTTSETASEDEGDNPESDDEILSDDGFDGNPRISSKSLTSQASSVKPKSFNSATSQQSFSSSSTSREAKVPSSNDLKRIREQLRTSLQEEKALLNLHQQLLGEIEEVEHAMIKAKIQERLNLVTSQQAVVMGVLSREDVAI